MFCEEENIFDRIRVVTDGKFKDLVVVRCITGFFCYFESTDRYHMFCDDGYSKHNLRKPTIEDLLLYESNDKLYQLNNAKVYKPQNIYLPIATESKSFLLITNCVYLKFDWRSLAIVSYINNSRFSLSSWITNHYFDTIKYFSSKFVDVLNKKYKVSITTESKWSLT